jgi:hypothetical protein
LQIEGFVVLPEPSLPNIAWPEWFRPDIVALKDDVVTIVSIKSARATVPPEQIAWVRELVSELGWEFRLWSFDPLDLDSDQRLRAPQPSDDPLGLVAALNWPTDGSSEIREAITACARVEAVTRAIADEDQRRHALQEELADRAWDIAPSQDAGIAPVGPLAAWDEVLGYLATHGFLEPPEYILLRDALAARDSWVHGLRLDAFATATVGNGEQLSQLATAIAARAREIWERSS